MKTIGLQCDVCERGGAAARRVRAALLPLALLLACAPGARAGEADGANDWQPPRYGAPESGRCDRGDNGKVIGGAVGALIGGAIGAEIAGHDDRRTGALLGAAVGALIGSRIGKEIERGNEDECLRRAGAGRGAPHQRGDGVRTIAS